MDSDFWTSRLAAAKRQFQHQHHQLHATSHLDGLSLDDFDVEEELRSDIPCPYCYEDFDIASLSTHLEEHHHSDSKPTVCPICSVKVCRDVLSHITLQHGHLFKEDHIQRRRRLRRVAIPNSPAALPLLGRDLREAHLQILLGGASTGFRSSTSTMSDPFLSSLVLNLPGTDPDDISTPEDVSVNSSTKPPHSWKPIYLSKSFDPCLTSEDRERMIKKASGRADFVQDLLFCTLLQD